MYEQWHPLGIVGVISAFNFTVVVWSWIAMLSLVCGSVLKAAAYKSGCYVKPAIAEVENHFEVVLNGAFTT